MAAMQRVAHSSVTTSGASSYGSCKGGGASGSEPGAHDQFPAGLRVLVVDDDVTCLRIVEQMLIRCRYYGPWPPSLFVFTLPLVNLDLLAVFLCVCVRE